MKTKLTLITIIFSVILGSFAQNNLNEYKYVIVPNKFDFQKTENSYRLNELSQFLFNKYGFTALMEGKDYPKDLSANRCLALRSNVLSESGMFRTKLKVVLKNCDDKVIYTSKIGESKEKEYKVAYNKAIRMAFTSFQTLNYSYKPSKKSNGNSLIEQVEIKNETAEEIEKLKAEIQNLKKEKGNKVENKKAIIAENSNIIKEENVSKKVSEKLPIAQESSNILYAQEIENGFQLVDSSPKVVYRIKNTGLKDVFLVEGKTGIIYKNGDLWFLEHYNQSKKVLSELNIKF